MTKEELLIQRYKAIAPYPGSRFEVGDILYKYVFETSETGRYTYTTNLASPLQGVSLHREHVESMPHLFKPLQWWEDRKVEGMPEYVRSIQQEYQYGIKVGKLIKVKRWVLICETMYVIQSHKREYHSSCFVPATKEEYEAYIKGKEGEGEKDKNAIDLTGWPKSDLGAFVCSKDKPMPLHLAKAGRWEHDNVNETDADSDTYIEWKCDSCGHVWRTEMPQ